MNKNQKIINININPPKIYHYNTIGFKIKQFNVEGHMYSLYNYIFLRKDNKIHIYDYKGNFLLTIKGNRYFDMIYNGYYICAMDPICVINLKTSAKTSYIIRSSGQCYLSNKFMWTYEYDTETDLYNIFKMNILTGELLDQIVTYMNVDEGLEHDIYIHDIGDVSYFEYYDNNQFKIKYYDGNSVNPLDVKHFSQSLYNSKYIVLWQYGHEIGAFDIMIYKNNVSKSYRVKYIYDVNINEKYIVVLTDNHQYYIYTFQMQLLYSFISKEFVHPELYKFITVNTKYEKHNQKLNKYEIYRAIPDCIIWLKNKVKNTQYWNILRMI